MSDRFHRFWDRRLGNAESSIATSRTGEKWRVTLVASTFFIVPMAGSAVAGLWFPFAISTVGGTILFVQGLRERRRWLSHSSGQNDSNGRS